MSSLNKSSFLRIFLSYLPLIMLFFSVFNEFDFNYLKLDYFAFNFVLDLNETSTIDNSVKILLILKIINSMNKFYVFF